MLASAENPVVALLFLCGGRPTALPDHGVLQTDLTGAEQWSSRLDGLLVARHDLLPDRATELVDEARTPLLPVLCVVLGRIELST